MKHQFKAAFLIKPVFDQFRLDMENPEKKLKILGLFDHISTFDVITQINLTNPDVLHPLLAVSNNLICRGAPTLASTFVSKILDGFNKKFTPEDFFIALHLIDTRPDRPSFYTQDLGSQFEAAFLNNYIKSSGKILTQLFQHQRDLGSITGNLSHSRCDFSFESPYFKEVSRDDVFHKEKRLKQKEIIRIIEIDGAKYHQNIQVDDLRDSETANFGAFTSRISESNASKDVDSLMNSLRLEPYIQVIYELTKRNSDAVKNLQKFTLIPLAIARLQKLINQFLISNPQLCSAPFIKIAILERDLPCGQLAIDDLNQLYQHLNGLAENQFILPKILVDIFSDNEYGISHDTYAAKKPETLIPAEYNLIIDNAILWRTGIFQADKQFAGNENAAIIRSAHFTEHDHVNTVYSAKPITYRSLTREAGNENHLEIEEAIPFIEYFLKNIFFKDHFRKGQLPILNRALQNKSVIGLLPTGGGKSLTYQLAALLQPGITIIIDPIRSLMVDQFESLINIGIDKCDFINSILTTLERKFVQNRILPESKAQFIFCSPERLVIQEFRNALDLTKSNKAYFTYCVIDEAHCVSEWGHDFRTPYLNLGENAINHCHTFTGNNIPLFGLTATASFDVLADIERELKIEDDDGKAIIRYENTIRDELNYAINHIVVKLDDPHKKVNKAQVGALKSETTKLVLEDLFKPDAKFWQYNNPDCLRKILTKTYNEFLPEFEKQQKSLEDFISEGIHRIRFNSDNHSVFSKDENGKYSNGAIVFCPHTGKPNQYNSRSELGVLTYLGLLQTENTKHTFGFFIGSGNDENAAAIDKDSFDNLKKFKENRASVMIATKAFGMGIDKSNIRMTIHANIPSSIESFVQESGRAGRDGKTGLSVILYNNQISRDKEVILSFHRNSFKGADKERSVLWELRNGIFTPFFTNLVSINNQLNELFEVTLFLELGRARPEKDSSSFIFIKNESNFNVGWINFERKNWNVTVTDSISKLYYDYIIKLVELIPDFRSKTKVELLEFLKEKQTAIGQGNGIEKLLREAAVGESFSIQIPFKNAFYAKPDSGLGNITDGIALESHFNHFISSSLIKNLLLNKMLEEDPLYNAFRNAVEDDQIFEEFIGSLNINRDTYNLLINTVMLRVRYYLPRNVSDTAKAIYRLTSVGIIDSYTIDYLNKQFKINFKKKEDEVYFDNFSRLIERYTSQEEAKKIIKNCRLSYQTDDKATVISKVLEHLTLFIYDKIADKRLRAIDDMVNLCNESINITDPLLQSERIKENIYYYFNAKYTRKDNKALTSDGAFINADLNFDSEQGLSFNDTIWKYIEIIIPFDDNGAIINNLKHLRGASMRMLRSRTGSPQYNILKAFCLFALSKNIPDLLEEAQQELSAGILLWDEIEGDKFNFSEFYLRFKQNIFNHLGAKDDLFFGNPDDYFLVTRNLNWLKKFNQKLSKSN